MHNLCSTREIFHRTRILGRQRYNVKVKLACSFSQLFLFLCMPEKKAVLFHQGRKRVDNNAYSLYIVLSLIIKSVQNDGQKV